MEDAGRLRQILFNLMSNAIKFTDAGSVSLTVGLEVAEFGEQIVFVIADTGVGIPPDKLEAVFESFRQADSSITRGHEGAGLGLAICQRLARAMGGDIYIDSTLGRGTTVSARLPLERAAEEAPAAAGASPPGLEDCRLLICDANPLSQSVIKAVLQPHVRTVEAIAGWSLAEEGRFDLVLVDASALGAERPAQLEALRGLAEAVSPAAVCLLIANLGDDDGRALVAAGAAQIIRKPIAAGALAGELRAGVAARRAPERVISAA